MKNFIPLWCWGCTLILVMVVIAVSQLYAGSQVSQQALLHSQWNSARLNNLKSNSVVAIGTSLFRNGFYYDGSFDELAAARGVDVSMLRFDKSGGTPEDFVWLVNKIDQSDLVPKVLFLQLEPFMLRQDVNNVNYLAAIQFDLHQLIMGLLGESYSFNGNYAESQFQEIMKIATIKDMKAGDPRTHQLAENILPAPFSKILSSLRTKGVKIIFVRMNYAIQRYTYLNPRNFNDLAALWIEKFERNTHYPVWQFNSLDMSYYNDTAHLNGNGREVFFEWLMEKIKQEKVL